MGIPSLALGFTAGVIGERIKSFMHDQGVTTDFLTVGGQSRINTIIIAEDDHTHTTITTSTLLVEAEHIAALRSRFELALKEATCVVLGGTLPQAMEPAFYTDMIGLARAARVPVIFDANEPNLSAGLLAGPTYIKPNRDELSALCGQPVNTLEEAYRAGQDVLQRYGTMPIITLGEGGALAVLQDRSYYLPPIDVPVISPAGAGDAVLAGLAASIYRGQPIEEGLRLGVAAATAVVTQDGTAFCHNEDIQRYLSQVVLQPYSA